MTDIRNCDQCDVPFTPRREHARLCSARCRARWNRRHAGGGPADASALDWSITAMRETIGRLRRAGGWDLADGLAVISEAVWRVTLVDAVGRRRRCRRRCLDLEAGPRARPRHPHRPRPGLGTGPVPGLPGPARQPPG